MKQSINTEANTKKSKAAIAFNILTIVVLALSLMFLIEALYAHKNMHNNYFGYAVLPIASRSMESGESDELRKGDLIFVKLLSEKEKRNLKVGDIITFKYPIPELDSIELVTHRIIEVHNYGYTTHGDANSVDSTEEVGYDSVVGVYRWKINGIGHMGLFFETKMGSFVMIVVPFLALLLLSIFHFIKSLRIYSHEKLTEAKQEGRGEILEEERERIRQEILREMSREKASIEQVNEMAESELGSEKTKKE